MYPRPADAGRVFFHGLRVSAAYIVRNTVPVRPAGGAEPGPIPPTRFRAGLEKRLEKP